jgi:hypothetical protein
MNIAFYKYVILGKGATDSLDALRLLEMTVAAASLKDPFERSMILRNNAILFLGNGTSSSVCPKIGLLRNLHN